MKTIFSLRPECRGEGRCNNGRCECVNRKFTGEQAGRLISACFQPLERRETVPLREHMAPLPAGRPSARILTCVKIAQVTDCDSSIF
ncbi:MAG: hypothetical protein J7495_03685 [Sphingomonas sp.]|nr:hypothetical protein [Sphingomonas sp.]